MNPTMHAAHGLYKSLLLQAVDHVYSLIGTVYHEARQNISHVHWDEGLTTEL